MKELKTDCYAYIRGYYGVPAYVGMRVRVKKREGVLVEAKHSQHYVHIRLDGDKRSDVYHPTDGVEYRGVEIALHQRLRDLRDEWQQTVDQGGGTDCLDVDDCIQDLTMLLVDPLTESTKETK